LSDAAHAHSHHFSGVRLSVNFYIFDFFSRTTGQILTRLCTNDSWVEGIQFCSTKGDNPFPRGDNGESKNTMKILKIFSRTSRPNSIKLNTGYPWVKGIQVCSNKGPSPLQRGDNHKYVKIGCMGSFKYLFLQNHFANFNQTWYKSSLGKWIQVCSNEGDSKSKSVAERFLSTFKSLHRPPATSSRR
jgi:hypothetical protein